MSKKFNFSFLLIFSLIFLSFAFLRGLPDGKLHLVFCDVGQGDAAYIRSPNGSDILIDGGPNERVLNCLGEHMPFWDRTIELIILSHPQADHVVGLIEVLKRYRVSQIIDSSAKYDSQIAKTWENLIKEKKIAKIEARIGERVVVDQNLELEIVWPKENLINTDINELSTVVFLKYGVFTALFTGDIGAETMNSISSFPPFPPRPLAVLKVPHHGSRNSLSQSFYETFTPQLAVISVGKNSYGHPSPEILNFLNSLNIKTLRTDQNGTIEIVNDGNSWSLPKFP